MYQITKEELTKAREQNILSDSAYAYFLLRLEKPDETQTQQVSNQLPAALLFTQLSKLNSKDVIKAQLNTFTVYWKNPAALPNLTRMRCREMEAQGLFQQTGYLYHALAAENPSKVSPQSVSVSSLQTFYNLSTSAILAEMSKLIEKGLASIELGETSVEWQPQTEISDFTQKHSTGTPASYQLSQSEVNLLKSRGILTDLGYGYLTVLLKLADFDTSQFARLEHNHEMSAIADLNEALNQLAGEINDKQPAGDYATTVALQAGWISYIEALNRKQPAGDYALNSAIATLQNAISHLQPAGDYISQEDLDEAMRDTPIKKTVLPEEPLSNDIWEQTSGDAQSFYRWFFDGEAWRGTQLLTREFSFNAATTATFWEAMNKNPEANAYEVGELFLTIKTAAANSSTKYHTINLTVRDANGSNSGVIKSFSTSTYAPNTWHSERISIGESQSITRFLSVEVLATNTPGSISGSVGFSYRWLKFA